MEGNNLNFDTERNQKQSKSNLKFEKALKKRNKRYLKIPKEYRLDDCPEEKQKLRKKQPQKGKLSFEEKTNNLHFDDDVTTDIKSEVVDKNPKLMQKQLQKSKLNFEKNKVKENDGLHFEIDSFTTGLDISTVYSILKILELKGMIKELTGRTFTLS